MVTVYKFCLLPLGKFVFLLERGQMSGEKPSGQLGFLNIILLIQSVFALIYDKNSPESKHRRNIPQHNKSHI